MDSEQPYLEHKNSEASSEAEISLEYSEALEASEVSALDCEDADREELLRRGFFDPVWACFFFLPHWFPPEVVNKETGKTQTNYMPWLHRGILAIYLRRCEFLELYGDLDKIIEEFKYELEPGNPEAGYGHVFWLDPDGHIHMETRRYFNLMIPRGFSKTTIINAAMLFDLLYEECPFGVYISETLPHSKQQLENVKREIESNERIKFVFGRQAPTRSEVEVWSRDLIELKNGCVLVARGHGSQVRGLNHRGRRPWKIVLDDVESKESVKTKEQRDKTQDWFLGDVLPALPEMVADAGIVAAGTLLHPEALLQTFRLDPEWTSVVFGAQDSSGAFLWPENLDGTKLELRKEGFARRGKLHLFYMEYYNQVRAPEDQKFKAESFIWSPPVRGPIYRKALAVDPAISESQKADHATISVVQMSSKDGKITVMESWGGIGKTPRELVDKIFSLRQQFEFLGADLVGIESNAYQAALIHLVREEMFRHKDYFEITPITHSRAQGHKDERIELILQPRYANGYIVHARRFPSLESQLLDWPMGKRDYADSLAMAISLLDPAAPWAGNEEGNDPSEDFYPPLDEVFPDGWETAV